MPRGRGSTIDYRAAAVEALDGQFDLVTSMEVIEHVADQPAFVAALAARLAPGGLMILSTPNRDRLVEAADDHAGRRASGGSPRARTTSTSSSSPTR